MIIDRPHDWNPWTGRCNICGRLRYVNDEVPMACLSEGERREATDWDAAARAVAKLMAKIRKPSVE